MKNWKKVFFTAAALVTIANAEPVFACIIPGLDRPWDPSTYWLSDTIDVADTANPSYFFGISVGREETFTIIPGT